MKTILITGAGGYLGGELAKKHIELEPDVRVKCMIHSGKAIHPVIESLPNCEWFHGDINHPETFEQQMEGVDEVYHLAAYARVWNRDFSVFERINVEGTRNVLEKAIEQKVKKVVVTSTAGTFGPQQDERLITEEINQPKEHFTEYERTKFKAYQMALKYTQQIPVVFVSPTRVFGPGALSVSNAVTKVIHKYAYTGFRFMPGDGEKMGNYVFIEDIVNGHILAMKHGRNGENYILGGENLSYRQMFDVIGEVNGRRKKMIGVPIDLLMLGARFMKFKADVFKQEPLILPTFARKYLHDWGTDVSKAVHELNYTFTPFKEGVKKTLKWMDESGLSKRKI